MFNPQFNTTAPTTTNIELLPALTPRERTLLQRVVAHYHGRKMMHWVECSGERVPSNHIHPPDITDWSRSKILKVTQGYMMFCKSRERIDGIKNISENWIAEDACWVLMENFDPRAKAEVLEVNLSYFESCGGTGYVAGTI